MDHEGRTLTSARWSTEEHADAVVRSTVVVVVEGVVRVGHQKRHHAPYHD
jgi:hypothetical protein